MLVSLMLWLHWHGPPHRGARRPSLSSATPPPPAATTPFSLIIA
ncbi:hypothetical protein ATKI12_2331 [Kitasatospora sp. Ki12]